MWPNRNTRSDELIEVLGNCCGVGLWDAILVNEDALHPKSRWTWTNEFRRLLGYRNENDFPNVCQSWSDKLHPDDAGPVFAAFNAALKKSGGRANYDVTYRLKMADGKYHWFRATGGVVHDTAGKAIRACGSLVDINDMTLASAASKQRATALDTLTNAFDTEMSSLTETVSGAAVRFEMAAKQLSEFGGAHVRANLRRVLRRRAGGRQRHRRRRGRRGTRLLGRRNPPPGGTFHRHVARGRQGSQHDGRDRLRTE